MKTISTYIFDDLIDILNTHNLDSLALVCLKYAQDTIENNVTYTGMGNAPAGKFIHHAYPGGLVDHYIEMFELHKSINPKIKDIEDKHVLEAIVLHDLHKACLTFRYPTEKEKEKQKEGQWFEYSDHEYPKLMSNNELTLFMLLQSNYKISSPLVMNALVNSEGGYCKNPSKFVTTFAKYIYTLDELSSNVLAREDKGNHIDAFNIRSIDNTWRNV